MGSGGLSQQVHDEFLKKINRDGYVKAFELEVLSKRRGEDLDLLQCARQA